MGETQQDDPSRKRSRTDPDAAPPPPYGSKEYWEQRYERQFDALASGKEGEAKTEDKDKSTLPFHSWYFTYDELRPLLLPILLGGREAARHAIGNSSGDDEDDFVDTGDEESQSKNPVESVLADRKSESESTQSSESNTAPKDKTARNETSKQEENSENGNIDEDESEDAFEEYDGESDDEEDQIDRDGIASKGPVAILEVGCGDVPLGAALAVDLNNLEQSTESMASNIVTKILCTDYSKVVVDKMTEQYKRGKTKNATATYKSGVEIGNVPLEFATVDARKLPYADNAFSFVIEKGTLDAMLSDKVKGVSDCISIVSECARVLAHGGCLILISHLNAHTPSGVNWMEEVVFAGLQNGGGQDAIWEIEVHGNSEIVNHDENSRIPQGSSGPAVYVIHKSNRKDDGSIGQSKIPVKLFSY